MEAATMVEEDQMDEDETVVVDEALIWTTVQTEIIHQVTMIIHVELQAQTIIHHHKTL